jgi:mannose/fructose-specific phosphotransferase system component IIA
MHLNWILNPLAQHGMLAAGLIACLSLFLALKLEVRAVRRRAQESRDALAAQVQQMESALGHIRQSVTDIEERPGAVSPGLNLTRRAQALRMHRRGESVETIAAALSAPRNEIDLLLKVQAMLQYRNTEAGECRGS